MTPNAITADDMLAEAMRSGDTAALGAVIERYTAYVGTIVWNIVRGKLSYADAEEIVSDVFGALWYNADKIRAGRLKSYLAAIARRRALNALRGAKPEMPLEDEAVPLTSEDPEAEAVRREEYEALRKTIDALPEPDRTVFIRHYYLCHTTGEIARGLGLNVSTVQMKLWRGRERLRRELKKGGYFIE